MRLGQVGEGKDEHIEWTPGTRSPDIRASLAVVVWRRRIWAFRFPAPTKSYMDYYTLVTPEFVAKPIYDAIKDYTGNDAKDS